MNREEINEAVQCLIDSRLKLDEIIDMVQEVFGDIFESKLHKGLEVVFNHQYDFIVNACKIPEELLSWFVYENEFGKKGMEAGVDNELREIKTIDDFLWFVFDAAPSKQEAEGKQ